MIRIYLAKNQGVIYKQKVRNIDGTTTPRPHQEAW